jgi:4-hydroxybenzoate polyprenyltransferase
VLLLKLTIKGVAMYITNTMRNNTLILLFKQMRPKQWTKNLLVFAALIFSIKEASISMFYNSILGFFLFSFISGCVYILNDYVDREADRLHPEKKYRPMASGQLNSSIAISFGVILFFVSVSVAFFQDFLFGSVLCIYFLINVGYSLHLKNIVILDVMIIAAGFVLRAIGGGFIIGVPLTPWFIICTLLLALFLAVSKRRNEITLLKEGKISHRKVLAFYSPALLDQLISIVTTAAVISYGLFTFTSGHTIQLMWTIPFVIYGIFRYLYLIYMEDKGGSPEKVLLEDKHILLTVTLFAVSVILILVIFE